MYTIQRIQPSSHVSGRYLVFLEGDSLLKVTEEEMVRFGLHTGLMLSEERFAQLTQSADASHAMAAAGRIVSARTLSKGELLDKLVQNGHSPANAHAAADYLEEIGAIDDAQYARTLAWHYSARGYGIRKIQSEFYRRKVPRVYWAEALEELAPTEETIDRLIEKKLRGRVPDRKELGKISAFLARRGFCWEEIKAGLNRYDTSPDEYETYS